MVFIGLITRKTPHPLFEAQVQAVLRTFHTYTKGIESGSKIRGIVEQVEIAAFISHWEALKAKLGDEDSVIKTWHPLDEPETYDYRDQLSVFAETNPLGSSPQEPMTVDSLSHKARVSCPECRVRVWERFGYARKDLCGTPGKDREE